jgi:DNA-binding CsgD family transcriptional regulator
VVLLSYSGGAQVATGAVDELHTRLHCPLTVITLGGFHNGANDLTHAERVHQLTSAYARIERVGTWLFPQRWRLSRGSGWNRARRAGKVTVHRLDPATHLGPGSYISPRKRPPDGRSHLDRTAAWRGREREARALIDAILGDAVPRGQGAAVTVTHWYHAVLCNGLGQYADALAAAQEAAAHQREFAAPRWGLVELIEAAVRSGAPERATEALEQLAEATRASGTDWALGVEARSRALLTVGDAAERFYREAIERLDRTRIRVELARAHLLYGEWLRRENRRIDARGQLGVAHEMFSRIGAAAFAARTRGELLATGARVGDHAVATNTALTAQEAQIARLAGQGLTNPEIGAQLFISRHTVEWHLRKVFSKLGIASRKEIRATWLEGEATSAQAALR